MVYNKNQKPMQKPETLVNRPAVTNTQWVMLPNGIIARLSDVRNENA
jgi:hypothetical protein